MRKLYIPLLFLTLFSETILSQNFLAEKISQYFNSANVDKISAMRDIIDSDTNLNSFQKFYYNGFINNFLGDYYLDRDDELSEKYLTEAVNCIEKAVVIKPSAELYALLASANGRMVAHVSIFSKMSQGNKSAKYLEKAGLLDSNSIFIKYENAVGLMYRPALFGGDKEEAKSILKSLVKNYNTYKQDHLEWITLPLLYSRLMEIAKMEGEKDEVKKYRDILSREFPDFNPDR